VIPPEILERIADLIALLYENDLSKLNARALALIAAAAAAGLHFELLSA